MFQSTELFPGYGRKLIEMVLCVIKERGLSFPPSILRENHVVRSPNPWHKDSAGGYPVTTRMCQENLLEFLIL
jgi:hypothetical protein